jgi:hypothetical protein
MTYICREQSFVCVFHPPPPLPPASVSSPRTKGGGVHTRGAVRGVNILEDTRHRIGLVQYNLSTALAILLGG